MERAARLAVELGFDGVDINMGCPDRGIEKQGAGAALMKTPSLARELIKAARRGAELEKKKLPISIKTRIGYNKNEIETWLPELLAETPVAITVHARTRKEMSKVTARWDVIARAVEIRDEAKSRTLIVGNGDVLSIDDAQKKAKETSVDGVMLGKAIFGNPSLFSNSRELENRDDPRVVAKILFIAVEHTKLFEELFVGSPTSGKNFSIMKKHYKAYVNGFGGAKELRMKLMDAENAKEVEGIVSNFLKTQ